VLIVLTQHDWSTLQVRSIKSVKITRKEDVEQKNRQFKPLDHGFWVSLLDFDAFRRHCCGPKKTKELE
jgi:hypothetical protein